MTQFIEVTSTYLEKKVSINVAYRRDVVEKENGCFITTYEDNKKGEFFAVQRLSYSHWNNNDGVFQLTQKSGEK